MRHTFYTVKVTAPGFCQACRCERRVYRRSLNHGFQLIVTLVTAGLWAIPWMAMWIVGLRRPWRCQLCRWPVGKDFAPLPTESAEVLTAAPWAGSGRR